jgi:hypothetical protein
MPYNAIQPYATVQSPPRGQNHRAENLHGYGDAGLVMQSKRPLICGLLLWSCRESNAPQKGQTSCGNAGFHNAKRRETTCGYTDRC